MGGVESLHKNPAHSRSYTLAQKNWRGVSWGVFFFIVGSVLEYFIIGIFRFEFDIIFDASNL